MQKSIKQRIKIGDCWVGYDDPCFIVAEIGLNHNGSIKLAKELVKKASECNVNAVKFQKRNIDRILTKELLNAPYDVWYSYGKTYGEHRKALELSDNEFVELKEYADDLNIIFFASPWDETSADFLEKLEVSAFKIASADLTNTPLIEYIAKKKKPMIVSTGMATFDDIEKTVNIVTKYNDELILLHCVSTYPSEYGEINLRCIESLRDKFGCIVGYSGHEKGIAVSEAAVTMGARVIERHFTLDRTMKGPDHAASLEPPGLFRLARDIRNIESAMGEPNKKIQEREIPIKEKLTKSVVAAVRIPRGTVISAEMLTIKGPGRGLSPKYIYTLPGKKSSTTINEDDVITEEMIEW